MPRRRLRKPQPLANATTVRAILAEIRSHFPALPLKRDREVVNFLRAALHATSSEASFSRFGRRSRWARETLLTAASIAEQILAERTHPILSLSSFVKHHCAILDFPADVLAALEAAQLTLFEAEQLARVRAGRLGLTDGHQARQARATILASHLRSHGTATSLRVRVNELDAVKAAVTSLLLPDDKQTTVMALQAEIDAFAEKIEVIDYSFLFVDSLTFIVQNMLLIDPSRLVDADVDRLLAKLDDVVEVVREAVAKSHTTASLPS